MGGRPVTDVALEIGYKNTSGATPSRFRAAARDQ